MLQVRRVLWFAIAFSTVIYAGIIYFITHQQVQGSYEDSLKHPFVLPLYALGLVTFLITMFVMGRFKLGNAQAGMIVRMALYEAIAVFGLVAAFVTHDWRVYLAPWALALMGFVREWPSSDV